MLNYNNLLSFTLALLAFTIVLIIKYADTYLKYKRHKEVVLYESKIIQFNSISDENVKKNIFFGTIQTLDYDAKKVTFENNKVKKSFNFSNFNFNNRYLVDVKVHYNLDGTIDKYCITENLWLLE